MNRWLASLRATRLGRAGAVAGAALAATLVLAVTGAVAHDGSVPAPPDNPTSADQIQNIDQVKTAIKAYYGDTPTTTPDPVNGATTLHTYSPTGAYVDEMQALEADADGYLDKTAKHFGGHGHNAPSGTPAILLDIDDTTLNTYSYEIYSNFVFNPTTNAAFVNASVFPPVPGMPDLEHTRSRTATRSSSSPAAPVAHDRHGHESDERGLSDTDSSHLFLKDLTAPWLASCATSTCATTQYKSLTRQHIESLGYDIVANFGDQFSDLNGGFADATFKVPNPMYFLP